MSGPQGLRCLWISYHCHSCFARAQQDKQTQINAHHTPNYYLIFIIEFTFIYFIIIFSQFFISFITIHKIFNQLLTFEKTK